MKLLLPLSHAIVVSDSLGILVEVQVCIAAGVVVREVTHDY